MLHIQESFAHNSSLLMAPMIPPTVPVQPQPSTSSRSIKVIEQLANRLEDVQREIVNTKIQLESAQKNKYQYEKDTLSYTNSNKVYRSRIKEIMHVLENKQKVLEVTKQSSTQLEIKVKQLKDEALASRHQLEDLRRREQVLEHDRDVAVKEKNQIKHKKGLLQDSVDQLRARCEREMALLQNDLSVLVNELKQMTDRNMKLMDAVDRKIKQRQQCLEDLYLMKKQLRSNTEAFVEKVRTELQEFKTEIKQSALQTKDCTHAAIQCRGEVNGLVTKIKTIAAEITASEEKH